MKSLINTALLLLVTGLAVSAQNANVSGKVLTTSRTAHFELRQPDPQHHFDFSLNTFLLPNHTWGYDVLADGAVLFHQVEMPGKKQGVGFATKEDAAKVAAYIIKLLKAPVGPPVATIADMTNMDIH